MTTTVDLRGPLLPADEVSHIRRINDWIGSDSWVEGCRKDKPIGDEMSDYPEPKLPFRLLTNSYHDGAMRRATEIVYLAPSKRGAQHAKIEGVEYPDMPEPLPPGTTIPPKFVADTETRLKACEDMMAALQVRLDAMVGQLQHPAEHADRIADLETKVDALKPTAFVKGALEDGN